MVDVAPCCSALVEVDKYHRVIGISHVQAHYSLLGIVERHVVMGQTIVLHKVVCPCKVDGGMPGRILYASRHRLQILRLPPDAKVLPLGQ